MSIVDFGKIDTADKNLVTSNYYDKDDYLDKPYADALEAIADLAKQLWACMNRWDEKDYWFIYGPWS